jgi:hypothetical protein
VQERGKDGVTDRFMGVRHESGSQAALRPSQ